jgi:hypothetical protein
LRLYDTYRFFHVPKTKNPLSLRQNGLNALAGMFYVPRKLRSNRHGREFAGFVRECQSRRIGQRRVLRNSAQAG